MGKDMCTPVFVAALLPIVKMWKQAKCPLTEEWMKKMRDIQTYNRKLLSHKK